ncbi:MULTISPECIES: rhodanese-like domain-containing protein [unclassified Guyparkeria]|uniref:rhodanese-like domain-containing protein n=1 Tax=unclassified Guyparkeria TaxID=2626246 RepID=UPI0007335DA2|nr:MULTISPECIES: rhodanese-like domain-containing protein [unclassified Guyparkeria]KTG16172.1 sulfurtransferase [Guyparkeria sp. XI15]OAE85023.1 sulfurtransferase [Guyparkeria sp. WRN-7]
MRNITAKELATWLDDRASTAPVLLDVREPWEYQLCHIDGSRTMPMNTVPAHVEQLEPDRPIVCICHHGMRSMQVALFLEQQGFSDVINLTGGVDAWAAQVDSGMPTY